MSIAPGGRARQPCSSGRRSPSLGSFRLRPLPRDGGSGADLPFDSGPEQVPDQVGAGRTDQKLPSPLGDDTFYLNLRSVLQVMTFLSKGVCVPEEHVRSGVAPVTRGPDGAPFNWTCVTGGNFFVHAQKHRPRDAEAAVYYRGYCGLDIAPKRLIAGSAGYLETLFALQESDGEERRPTAHPPARRVSDLQRRY